MKSKFLSQEMLKLIACVSMLIDHVGYSFFPQNIILRIIGRIAFPIYCFLLAEGAHYTRDPMKYGLRLALFALISEIPFDLCVFGRISWEGQNVMLTLLLGFLAIQAMKRFSGSARLLALIPLVAAELLRTDYGAMGVLMVMVFSMTREFVETLWNQALRLFLLNLWQVGRYPIQLFATLAAVPISLYSGKKSTRSKALQWAFYLFYPAHLLILGLISAVW